MPLSKWQVYHIEKMIDPFIPETEAKKNGLVPKQ
jgi:hypothetical protein